MINPDHQTGFANGEHASKGRSIKRERFLNEMQKIVPWQSLLAAIETY